MNLAEATEPGLQSPDMLTPELEKFGGVFLERDSYLVSQWAKEMGLWMRWPVGVILRGAFSQPVGIAFCSQTSSHCRVGVGAEVAPSFTQA